MLLDLFLNGRFQAVLVMHQQLKGEQPGFREVFESLIQKAYSLGLNDVPVGDCLVEPDNQVFR